jgi:CubicO group peptidase (beta-lactamase class C family)
VHRFFVSLAVVLAVATFGQRTSAQTLTASLFGRYLESLREQAGIPGLSALVLQDGATAWEQGFGRANLDTGEPAAPYTPYLIGDLSQTFGAAILLRECVEESFATPNDPVSAWVPDSLETAALWHLLAHVTPANTFRFDRARFAALTAVIEACARAPYRKVLDDVFVRLQMLDAAPGTAMATPSLADRGLFDQLRLDYHAAVIRRLATPYALENGRPVQTTLLPTSVDAATGIIASVRDLARFDQALVDTRDQYLLRPTIRGAWTQAAPHLPTGLGWFVQNYNGNAVVWHFGVVKDAYSSLIVKVPAKQLTFILLANSDRLSTPFALENGDVTASVFARLFLRFYLP